MQAIGRVEFGVSTFCASCHANEQCGANGLPLTPNSIRILGRFQRLKTIEHPCLCTYLDLVRSKHERVIVVSEHYRDNLFERIKAGTVDRSPDAVVTMAYKVLLGLSHINSLGLVHRNLSPQFILFDYRENVRISNYGLYHMTGYGSEVTFPIGMPKYMSPEVLCSRIQMDAGMFDIDNSVFGNVCEMSMVSGSSPKCDVWSFGIILLETLLGRCIWEKLSLRQTFFKILAFLQSDVHPLDSIVREHQAQDLMDTLPVELTKLLRSCLTVSHSARPLPKELLNRDLFSQLKSLEKNVSTNSIQMFSTNARCVDLELQIYGDVQSNDDEDWSDLLSQRHITEIYYLWKLAGGDLEGALRKAGHIRSQPPIMQLPQLIIDDGESFGESRDSSSLFDCSTIILPQDQLRQRLKDVEPSAYFPLLENESMTINMTTTSLSTSHSSVDLQECARLPVIIRERDVEYQFHRIILFERLLKAYPYKRQQILKEARVDIPPLFRAHVWATVLEIEGDVEGRYESIDKESPIAIDRQIEVDIPRCHQYCELLSSPTGHVKFKRILKAWVVSHPEYVYWQGLDSLCAPFLYLNFNCEALAYACLSAFIPKYLHNFFLKDNACVIQEYLAVFSHLIAFHDPFLSNHLEEIGFIPDLYAIPWFLTMYAHVFPLHKIFHLWDTLLLGNSSFPLCIGVAILQQLRDQLLTFGFNECILLFSDMPEIDIEKCVQESIRIFCLTPKSATFRQHAAKSHNSSSSSSRQQQQQQPKVIHSYYSQDYHDAPANELSMDAIPLDELKQERFPRISAEDLIELCEFAGPSVGLSPAKRNKSTKPVIVIIDVRSEDEFKRGAVPRSINIPFHTAFSADGELIPCAAVSSLNQHKGQVKVIVGGSRGRHASHFAESLIRLGYSKVCVLHKGVDVLRSAHILTIPTPDL